jgi:acyl-CoA hydrolase
MANDPMRDLAQAGVLAQTGHKVGIAYGSSGFYSYLAESGLCAFATTLETHDPSIVGAIERFHAVNSALEVDLFGQVNVEWQSGRLSSGVGGAANFARAALASPGGRSIVALPATARGGTISRIVTRLTNPSIGLGRTEVGTVVTEHGVADVRHLGLDRRAEALISIAAPAFRTELQEAWSAMRSTF